MALSPVKGSTAPTITSPLLAWPSRPVQRARSPMSSPSSTYDSPPAPVSPTRPIPLAAQNTPSLALQAAVEEPASPTEVGGSTQKKGKGYTYVQTPTASRSVNSRQSLADRRYAPPVKPLSPAKLARIAQSFGIVIPASPAQTPGASSTASSSKLALVTPTRGSPHLLTVIPPSSLLPPQVSIDDNDVARRKRWKRGRLLPLQSTMGGMLLSIAKEYGLPSTRGIELYFVPSASTSPLSPISSASENTEEFSGPLISAATWSTLFNTQTLSTQSRNGSPRHSPLRTSTSSSLANHELPPSPVSLSEKPTAKGGRDSFGNIPLTERFQPQVGSATPSAHSDFPQTPRSTRAHATLSNLIVGTVEFDINPDVALWLDGWRRSSAHRRKRSVSDQSGIRLAEGGMRQLRLVSKVNSSNLRPFEETASTPVTPEEGLNGAPELTLVRTSESDDYRGLPYLVSPPTAVAALEDGGSTYGADPADANRLSELLASPIALDKAHCARAIDGVNRGSAIVMSEQLDALEKMMSELSPREIRLTSPRSMTPRMASKIAAAQAQLAQAQAVEDTLSVPGATRALPTSPLATVHQEAEPHPQPPKSVPPVLKTFNAPISPSVEPETPKMPSSQEFDKPSWPSLPYGSPESPRLNDMFPRDRRPFAPVVVAASPALSAESQKRAEARSAGASPASPAAPAAPPGSSAMTVNSTPRQPGWRPQRPPRPQSPELEHVRALSHALSPEFVDHLKSPPNSSPGRDVKRTSGGAKQRPRASGSLKAIRTQMSARNLNVKWSEGNSDKDKDKDKDKDVGGLGQAVDLRAVDEFGQENRPALSSRTDSTAAYTSPSSSLDSWASASIVANSANGKQGFAQRFLSFGRRHASRDGIPAPVVTQRSASAPKASTTSVISLPISSSLQHEGSGNTGRTSPTSNGNGTFTVPLSSHPVESPPRKSQSSTNTLPASPGLSHSVKRKPVPLQGQLHGEHAVRRGESLRSNGSIVSDDGPKERHVPLFNAI